MHEFSPTAKPPDAPDLPGVQPGTTDWFGGIFTAAPIFMAAIALFFISVVGFGLFLAVRHHQAAKRAGIDPPTWQTHARSGDATSHLPAPKKPREQRLAELVDLFARAKITREEYELARLRIRSDQVY